MISIVEGFGVGAGKSYFVVATQLIQHFIDGGTAYIADTMELKWPEFKEYIAREYGLELVDTQYNLLSRDQIAHIHEHTPPGSPDKPVLIVVDEAQGALNARDWADRSKRGLFDWCTQSRHDDNDLIFISQSAHNIDKQLRRLATYNWRVRNSEHLGEGNALKTWLKVWRIISFGMNGGPKFIVNQLDQDGVKPLGKKIFIDQDPRIFNIYTSKAMRGKHKRAGQAVAKVQLKKVGHQALAVRRPYMKYVIILMVTVLALAGYRLYKTDWSFGRKPATVQAVSNSSEVKTVGSDKPTAYEVEHEAWRARGGDWIKLADSGMYRVGRMSRKGMVQGIQDGVIYVRRPNGGLLYIVADDEIGKVSLPPPIPTPTGRPMVIAPWKPEPMTSDPRKW